MPRICTICAGAQREEINTALVSHESIRAISRRFGVSASALQRHRASHLPATLVKAAAVADVMEAGNLLERLKALNRETAAVLREARDGDSKNNDLALKAIARVEKQIELEGRLLGELHEGSTVNVILTPEWQALRAAIMAALEPYPTARLAVAGAVKNAGA
jgi:transposase-like protein